MKKALMTNLKWYLAEAPGLAIFMISASFFGGMPESHGSSWHYAIPGTFTRSVITGVLMRVTAIFIFYSPGTSPSGAQTNPAVTLTFLRLKKITSHNALFYIIFQFIGGMLAVHITGLRTGQGPGIEFLQYLQPGPGKPYPADSRTDDIWHWQTTLLVNDAEKLFHLFQSPGYKFVSKELVHLQSKKGMHSKAFIVRDPDGHAALIRENITPVPGKDQKALLK